MPHRSFAHGAEVLAADFNPYVADQVVATYPNAAARTAEWGAVVPPLGAVSLLTDGGTLHVWNGTRWSLPWSLPWGLLDYKLAPGPSQTVNAWTDVTGLTSTLTYVANRRIKLTAYTQMQSTASVCVAGTNIQEGVNVVGGSNTTSEAAGHPVTQCPFTVISPTAGADTYKVQAQTGSPSGQVLYYATTPASLLIEDIGPNGAPA